MGRFGSSGLLTGLNDRLILKSAYHYKCPPSVFCRFYVVSYTSLDFFFIFVTHYSNSKFLIFNSSNYGNIWQYSDE